MSYTGLGRDMIAQMRTEYQERERLCPSGMSFEAYLADLDHRARTQRSFLYETGGTSPVIRRVECESTPTEVTLREGLTVRTVPRITPFRQYHDTFIEAKEYLIEQVRQELAHRRRQIANAEAQLGRYKVMKEQR